MATNADLLAATLDPRNHELYRAQCELEISSTFAFQANKWLSDIAPEILTESQRARLPLAKIKAAKREEIDVQHTTALSISNRYAELIRLKEQKERTTKSTRKPRREVRTQNTNAPSQ